MSDKKDINTSKLSLTCPFDLQKPILEIKNLIKMDFQKMVQNDPENKSYISNKFQSIEKG